MSTNDDHCMTCPNCGYVTDIDPALIKDEDPMPYCPECDEPLITIAEDQQEGD